MDDFLEAAYEDANGGAYDPLDYEYEPEEEEDILRCEADIPNGVCLAKIDATGECRNAAAHTR